MSGTVDTAFRLGLPLLGLLLLGGGGLALRAGAADARRRARSVPARGTVGRVDTDAELAPIPTVRYLDASGAERTARAANARLPSRYTVGQTVALRYDPQDPGWVIVGGGPDPATADRIAAGVLISLGLLGLAGWIVLLTWS